MRDQNCGLIYPTQLKLRRLNVKLTFGAYACNGICV